MTQLFRKMCLNCWQCGWRWQNYQLLARALHAAWLVQRQLAGSSTVPSLAKAIAAVAPLQLAQQPHWHGPGAAEIFRFAAFVAAVPHEANRCVARSLIAYRLLNGYGFPARLCFGIQRQNPARVGHAWVELCATPRCALGETSDPYEQFVPVFTAPQSS